MNLPSFSFHPNPTSFLPDLCLIQFCVPFLLPRLWHASDAAQVSPTDASLLSHPKMWWISDLVIQIFIKDILPFYYYACDAIQGVPCVPLFELSPCYQSTLVFCELHFVSYSFQHPMPSMAEQIAPSRSLLLFAHLLLCFGCMCRRQWMNVQALWILIGGFPSPVGSLWPCWIAWQKHPKRLYPEVFAPSRFFYFNLHFLFVPQSLKFVSNWR